MTHTEPEAVCLRRLPPYEPPFVVRRQRPEAAGQLTLPLALHPTGRTAGAGRPERTETRPTPRPPTPDELLRLISAIIELAAGRRTASTMRSVLTDHAYAEIRAGGVADLARGYLIKPVHLCAPDAGVLEICATAVGPRHGRAVALVARLEANGDSWRFTRFAVIAPPRRERQDRLSAA